MFGSEAFHAQAEFCGSGIVRSVADAASSIREDVRAVFDGGRGFLLLFVAVVGDLHLAANRCGSDGVDEVIAGLDRRAIDGADHVATLESGVFRRAAGFDGFNHDAMRGTERLQRDLVGAEFFLELHADGTTSHAADFTI